MTVPTTTFVPKLVIFKALPAPAIPCAPYQSTLVRRVFLAASAVLAVLSAVAHNWAYYNFAASPMTVIRTVQALLGLTCAFATMAIALAFLPRSLKDPQYQKQLRSTAGNDIVNGGDLLPLPTILHRFQKLFDKKILVKNDIDALIYNELPNIKFAQFERKHGLAVLDFLQDDTKKALAVKFCNEISSDETLMSVKQSVWVQKLGISDEVLVSALFKDHFRLTNIQDPNYTFEQFEKDYGKNNAGLLTEAVKKDLAVKYQREAVAKGTTVRQIDRNFHLLTFGSEAHGQLVIAIATEQCNHLANGLITDYAAFKAGNGFVVIKQAVEKSEFKAKARELFLKMPAQALFDPQYAEDRQLLGIEMEECIDKLNEWAQDKTYLQFKAAVGFKYMDKLAQALIDKFFEEIVQHLVANPEGIPQFAEEMKAIGINSDDIYKRRWSGYSLDMIVRIDGQDALCDYKARKEIKELLIEDLQGMTAVQAVSTYPKLFARGFFTPDDRPLSRMLSFKDRLEREMKGYEMMVEIAGKYGDGFYQSGLCSPDFIQAMVASFICRNVETFLFGAERPAITAPVMPQLEAIIREKREAVAAAKQLADANLMGLERRHKAALEQLKNDAEVNLLDSREKRELDKAKTSNDEQQAALKKCQGETSSLEQKKNRLSNDLAHITDNYRLVQAQITTLREVYSKLPTETLQKNRDDLEEQITQLKRDLLPLEQAVKNSDLESTAIARELNLSAKKQQLEAYKKLLQDPERLTNPSKTVKGKEAALEADKDIELIRTKIKPLESEIAGLARYAPSTVPPAQLESRQAQLKKERESLIQQIDAIYLKITPLQKSFDQTVATLNNGLKLKDSEMKASLLLDTGKKLRDDLDRVNRQLPEWNKLKAEREKDAAARAKELQEATERYETVKTAKELETSMQTQYAVAAYHQERRQITSALRSLNANLQTSFTKEIHAAVIEPVATKDV